MQEKISRDRLKELITVRCDEFLPDGSSVIGGTAIEAPIETIEKDLNLAAKYCLRNAREDLVHGAIETSGKMFQGDDVNDVAVRMDISDDLIATIVCPSNFLRIVAVKVSGAKREVRQFFASNSPEYKRHSADRFTGGNYAKPYGGIKSFDEYETKLTVADSSQFAVGVDVVGAGSPGVANVDIPTGVVKAIDSDNDIVTLKNVVGSFYTTGGRGYSSLDLASGGTPTAISAINTEHSKYQVLLKATENVDVSLLLNALSIAAENGSVAVATGDIIVLPRQTNPDENGTYKIGATADATVKLSNQISTENSKYAVEVFRAKATSDTLDLFHYVPDILPEYFPEELQDALIDVASARILRYMGNFQAYNIAINSARELLGMQKVGVEPVPQTQ